MQQSPVARSPALVAGGMILGAVLLFAGSFLTWFHVTGEETLQIKGTDFSTGKGVAFFAVLIAIFGALMLIRARKKGGRAWSITALVFGAFALFLAAQSALAPEAALPSFAAADVAEALGVSESVARTSIEEAFRVGAYNATSGIGAYVAFVGSVLAVVSAILGIVWAKRFRRIEVPSPPGSVEIPPMPPPPALPAT